MASSHAAPPGAAGRPLTDFEQVLLGVIASKHGIGILDASHKAPPERPESQLRHSKRKENYPGNLAIPNGRTAAGGGAGPGDAGGSRGGDRDQGVQGHLDGRAVAQAEGLISLPDPRINLWITLQGCHERR
jgi:hypothetical protein